MRLLIAFAVLLIVSSSGRAQEQTEERIYPSEFARSSLSEEALEYIKGFDRMAFAAGQDRFFGVDADPNTGQVNLVNLYSRLRFESKFAYLKPAANAFFHYTVPGIINAVKPEASEILVLPVGDMRGSPNVGQMQLFQGFSPKKSLVKAKEETTYLDNDRCGIWRQVDGYAVEKSLILIRAGDPETMTRDEKMSAVSCLNRGVYYHLGFNNAINMPVETFVEYYEPSKKMFMNTKFKRALPFFLKAGGHVGSTRDDILKNYLIELETAYARK